MNRDVDQSTAKTPLQRLRFPQKANREGIVPDHFVKLWNELAYFADNPSRGSVRRARAYLLQFLSALGACGASREEELAELTDSACVYWNCCKADRNFSSQVFGVMPLGESKLGVKLTALAREIAFTLPRKTELIAECTVLSQAFLAGFGLCFPQLEPPGDE